MADFEGGSGSSISSGGGTVFVDENGKAVINPASGQNAELRSGDFELGDDQDIVFGADFDYFLGYDSAGRLRLRSADIDGGGAAGDIFEVSDAGQIVNFLATPTVGGTAVVLATRTLTGGDGIDTLGDLSQDRTVAVDIVAGGGLQFSTGSLTVDEANIDHDSLSGFVANEHIDWTTDQGATNIVPENFPHDHTEAALSTVPNAGLTNSSITVTAGSGLSGGGSVALGASTTLSAALDIEDSGADVIAAHGINFTGNLSVTDDGDGTVSVDMTSSTASPGGSDGEVQYNNGGSFGGDTNLFWDDTNQVLGVGTGTPKSGVGESLHVAGSGRLRVEGSSPFIFLNSTGSNSAVTINFEQQDSEVFQLKYDPGFSAFLLESASNGRIFRVPDSDQGIRFEGYAQVDGDLDHDGSNIGFFGTTVTAQQTLTDNSGGTTDGTLEAVSGSGADAAINNNFAELRAVLAAYGLVA